MRGPRALALSLAILAMIPTPAGGTSRGPEDSFAIVFTLSDAVNPEAEPVSFEIDPNAWPDLALGDHVIWRNEGRLPHALADASGLFTWGPILPGEQIVFTPWAAGTYRFVERTGSLLEPVGSWEEGTFQVQPSIEGDFFAGVSSVRWATRPPPKGMAFDVQVSRGGFGQRWQSWLQTTSSFSGTYVSRRNIVEKGGCSPAFRARVADADDPTQHLEWAYTYGICVIVAPRQSR